MTSPTKERKYIIREIGGDWSLHIKGPGTSNNFLFFKSRNNAELVKSILEWEDAHPNKAVPYKPTLTPPNEWVNVEERLPTDERPVLVFVGYADTMTGFITTSSYFCFDTNPHWQWDGLVKDEQRTLFWMPLPAPPDRRPPEGDDAK